MSLSASVAGPILSLIYVAQGAEVVVKKTSYRVDFKGNLKLQIDPNHLSQFLSAARPSLAVVLKEHAAKGVGDIIGTIAVRMDPDRAAPQGIVKALTSGRPFPAIHDIIINIQVTMPDALPGLTLRSKFSPNPGPPILRNSNVTNFPPQNDIYQLVEPMDLEDVNDPGPVLATIKSFPLTVNPPTA